MSIDWITVAAQIANFLVLVWLLRRFLYRPILDGIDAREVEITNRMQEALSAKEQAQAAEEEYRDQVRTLNAQQSDMADAVRQEAEKQRDAVLAEAHNRMEQERATWAAHLDEEAGRFTTELHRAGAGALLSLTRKALTDLADETLESRMAHHLAERMKPMVPDLLRAAGQSTEAVFISRNPMPSSTQDDVAANMRVMFPGLSTRFETDAEQAPGLVLRMGGAQLDWTVESYIDSLAALMDEKLTAGVDLTGTAL
ncbi:MAG: F-type H+-transporting ATPase subunit b [Paracoccaceae bacterium]|jgi:F-type H+-transporting ATPase subunit b